MYFSYIKELQPVIFHFLLETSCITDTYDSNKEQ
jgi:hypothetical protein